MASKLRSGFGRTLREDRQNWPRHGQSFAAWDRQPPAKLASPDVRRLAGAMYDLARDVRQEVAPPARPEPCPLRHRADFAWEFLRRNPDYRLAWRRRDRGAGTAEVWGLEAAVDPEMPAQASAVCWRPEAAPAVVVTLAEAADRVVGVQVIARGWPVRHTREAAILMAPGGLQVRVRAGDFHRPLAVSAPLDEHFAVRVRTAVRLHRLLRGVPVAPDFSAVQARRLRQVLQALDGWRDGLTYRKIAQALFGARVVADEPWKTASVRDLTIRMVRQGRGLMQGGYRRFLETRPR
jgi:hypothetical protein